MTELSNVQQERLADLLCQRVFGGDTLSEQDLVLLAERSPEELAGLGVFVCRAHAMAGRGAGTLLCPRHYSRRF